MHLIFLLVNRTIIPYAGSQTLSSFSICHTRLKNVTVNYLVEILSVQQGGGLEL